MFKENFGCVAVHRGDAWACVILESSEFFWKYRLLKYKCTIAFSICIIARWCPWCILYQPECIWNNTCCVIGIFLSDCHHDVTSSADYAIVLYPELASRNQILPEMYWFDLQCYIDVIRVIMLCFVEEEGGSTPTGSRWCQNRRWATLDPYWSH